jgi:hypothetical protein
MIKPIYQYFLLAIGIFLIIGFPTFFSGCGTNIPNTCFAFTETTGTVYGHKITTDQCKECVQKDSDKKCTKYKNYDCYDGYVKIFFQSDNKNQTCLYEPYSDQKSFSDVKEKLEYYYPENYSNTLYVNKINDETCTFNSDGLKALTYVGIVFLSFGLIGIIGMVGYFLFDNIAKPIYHSVNANANTHTPTENNQEENKEETKVNRELELSTVI